MAAQITIEQLGSKLLSKYPQFYKGMDATSAGNNFIQSNPGFTSQVNIGAIQDPTQRAFAQGALALVAPVAGTIGNIYGFGEGAIAGLFDSAGIGSIPEGYAASIAGGAAFQGAGQTASDYLSSILLGQPGPSLGSTGKAAATGAIFSAIPGGEEAQAGKDLLAAGEVGGQTAAKDAGGNLLSDIAGGAKQKAGDLLSNLGGGIGNIAKSAGKLGTASGAATLVQDIGTGKSPGQVASDVQNSFVFGGLFGGAIKLSGDAAQLIPQEVKDKIVSSVNPGVEFAKWLTQKVVDSTTAAYHAASDMSFGPDNFNIAKQVGLDVKSGFSQDSVQNNLIKLTGRDSHGVLSSPNGDTGIIGGIWDQIKALGNKPIANADQLYNQMDMLIAGAKNDPAATKLKQYIDEFKSMIQNNAKSTTVKEESKLPPLTEQTGNRDQVAGRGYSTKQASKAQLKGSIAQAKTQSPDLATSLQKGSTQVITTAAKEPEVLINDLIDLNKKISDNLYDPNNPASVANAVYHNINDFIQQSEDVPKTIKSLMQKSHQLTNVKYNLLGAALKAPSDLANAQTVAEGIKAAAIKSAQQAIKEGEQGDTTHLTKLIRLGSYGAAGIVYPIFHFIGASAALAGGRFLSDRYLLSNSRVLGKAIDQIQQSGGQALQQGAGKGEQFLQQIAGRGATMLGTGSLGQQQ